MVHKRLLNMGTQTSVRSKTVKGLETEENGPETSNRTSKMSPSEKQPATAASAAVVQTFFH
jgi:hypothetical protein